MKKAMYILTFSLSCMLAYAQVNIQIDTHANQRKAISPLIYGLNAYVYTGNGSLTGIGMHDGDINSTSFRFGGDANSTYNWEINRDTSSDNSCHNPIPDIVYQTNSNPSYYSNHNNAWIPFVAGNGNSSTPAGAILKMVDDAEDFGVYPLVQITGFPYVAGDDDGCLAAEYCGNPAGSGRFKKVEITKPTALSLNPDTNDGFVYADEEINYLINKAGDSSTPGGIKGYCLENEPGIWWNTHVCLHPDMVSCGEILSTNINIAKRVKQLDPNAETYGPAAYGFSEYVQLTINKNFEWNTPGYYPADWDTYNMSDVPGYDASNYNYMTWLASYLRQMKIASDNFGSRLLDVLDVHYYIVDEDEGGNIRQDSRSFWDPTYAENTWIVNDVLGGQPMNLLHNFHKLIDDFYPDTKLSMTEWGHFDTANGMPAAIYISDVLGAFGKNDVYSSNYFGRVYGYLAGAFRIYRNYDGNNGKFGNTSVGSTSSNNSLVTAYGSIQNDSEGNLHIVLINRSTSAQNVNVSASTQQANYTQAAVYALLNNSNGAISSQGEINNIAGNSFTYTLQPSGIYHFVLKDPTMGTDELKTELMIYPNPVKSELNLMQKNKIGKVEIYDLSGKKLLEKSIQGNSGKVNVEKLSAGNYLLKTNDNTYKIIKK